MDPSISQILELVKNNQTAQLIMFGAFIAIFIIDKSRYWFQKKKINGSNGINKKDLVAAFEAALKRYENNGGKLTPGRSDSCIKHGERLEKLETCYGFIQTDLNQIKLILKNGRT